MTHPLSPFGARSFWYALAAIFLPIATRAGFDLGALLSLPEGNTQLVVDLLWEIVAPATAAFLAWWERRDPQRYLTFRGPLT